MTIRNRRAAHEIGDIVDQRLELRLAKQIHALKHNAVTDRCRRERKMNFFACVQRFTTNRNFPKNGALLHKYTKSWTPLGRKCYAG